MSRNVVTGTRQGEYMGIPPTGKSITYNEIFIVRFVNGRVAETWGVVDVLSQMKQLGLIPTQQRPDGGATTNGSTTSPSTRARRTGAR